MLTSLAENVQSADLYDALYVSLESWQGIEKKQISASPSAAVLHLIMRWCVKQAMRRG